MKKYSFKLYQENFPQLFLNEKIRIQSSIKLHLDIQHIGSTAVAGLGGKGIIDILIATEKKNLDLVSEKLQELGYEFRENASTLERLFLRVDLPDKEEGIRRYHAHLTFFESKEFKELVAFRDYLRHNPEEVEKYNNLKRMAAEKANNDGAIYRRLKDPFFKSVLEKNRKIAFEKVIIGTFGKLGRNWLTKLPKTIDHLKNYWELSDIKPIENMTYHYVAKAVYKQNIPVVIKIGCDKILVNNEVVILKHYQGIAAKLIDSNLEYNALLLEQAMPGNSLILLYPDKIDFVMGAYAGIINKLQKYSLPQDTIFLTIEDWLAAIDKISSADIPKKLLTFAITTKNKLLSTMTQKRLLHGDLHLSNILESQNKWICIDPKGVIGEVEFEVAAFDIFLESEINYATSDEFTNRINKLAKKTNLSFKRLKDWFFVRLVLSAAWSIEDNQNPDKAIKLASLLFNN